MNNSEYRIPVFEEVRCLISKNKKSNTVADTGVYGLVNGGFEFFSVILLEWSACTYSVGVSQADSPVSVYHHSK